MTDALDLDDLAWLERAVTPAPWDYDALDDAIIAPAGRLVGLTFDANSTRYGKAICVMRNALPRLLTLARAGERLAALWAGHEFDQYVRGLGYCCPVCAYEEMVHKPGCELAAALAGWRAEWEGR